ncbi:phosphate:Na+ symporter [Malonomonas rubra DSM 5091]|uniref:Phosphate:Na+ symporter n=1 Tax=Malonomonas rubra DSM 5091 TaxID=1122189 RepID=A0A1M6B8I2_MALRU|nr:Na/Pi cotransporter family protein [Malonomonas rubra]SHI44783.1 phosphate:Na+ symporter [Malonomonas rubra DSM 5091]
MSVFISQQFLFGLLGGLGLFLFGMKTMSEGLHKVAGEKIRRIFSALTNNRLAGTFVGMAVTAILQSSTATTVMTVSFVNAGLLSLVQAIGVILGANIGTTVTAQLIAFNITQFALPLIALGAAFKLFSRMKKHVYAGEIILGFGLLLFGLATMKQGFEPLKSSEDFRQLLVFVGQYKLVAVLIGALLTLVVQSSAATVGVTLAMATVGLINFETSVALVLGENIGTTITANISAIGANLAARRTAFAHFLFNVVGTVLVLLLLTFYLKLVAFLTPGDADFVIQTQAQAESLSAAIGDKPYIARHIANAHTLFNIINVLLFLPFVGILAKISTIAIRGKDVSESMQVKYIDNRILNTPPIAIGQARREAQRMAVVALEMLQETNYFLEDEDTKRISELERREELVDMLQREITNFLVQLSQRSISSQTSASIGNLLHIVNDLERIGDHCENLWQLGQKKIEAKIIFSDIGENEISIIGEKTMDFLRFVVEAMETGDTTIAVEAIEFEDCIDEMENRMRLKHIARLNTGECAVQPGLLFIDMLHNFEKIGDHTYKVSEAVIGER